MNESGHDYTCAQDDLLEERSLQINEKIKKRKAYSRRKSKEVRLGERRKSKSWTGHQIYFRI